MNVRDCRTAIMGPSGCLLSLSQVCTLPLSFLQQCLILCSCRHHTSAGPAAPLQ